MSGRAKFSDQQSEVTSVVSTWELDRVLVDAGCQTSEHLYQFAESEMQTGISTEVVTDEVKSKYEGMTLLDFMSKKHKRMSKDRWQAAIEKGKVTVANTFDFQVQRDPESKIAGEYVIEYVNVGADVGVQTMSIADVAEESGRTAGLNVGAEYKEGEGKHDDKDEYNEYKDDFDEGKDGRGESKSSFSSKSTHPVVSFVESKYSMLAAVLEENSSTTAFDGFGDASSGQSLKDKEVKYWNKLTVDLERKKIVYPDWGKAKHYKATVVKTLLTRNKERVYDVEFDDTGLIQHGLREEHIRVLGDPLNLGEGIINNPGKALNEGMKVHAPLKSKGATKWLPGRVLSVQGKAPNRNYDVECEGGKVARELTLADLVVGIAESQVVEARRPTITPLQATGVSWNSSGSSLGVAYGRTDITGWCNSPGSVCIWNVFGKGFQANNPDYTLDHASCLMCVAYHPTVPSIVAAGSFNGEVLYWDLSMGDDQPPIVSPIVEYTHTEPVTKLTWVRDSSTSASFLLCSTSADGRVLFWDLSNGLRHPVIGARVTRGGGAQGSSSSSSSSRGGSSGIYPGTYGVTSIAFSGGLNGTMRPQWLVTGQEGGSLLRAQAYRQLSTPRLTEGHFGLNKDSTTLYFDPGLYQSLRKGEEAFTHDAHVGNVTALDFSPFSRNLFLSCGSDGTIHLKHLLESRPLRQWEPSLASSNKGTAAGTGGGGTKAKDGRGSRRYTDEAPFSPVTGVQFSPTRPLVFAAASMSGCVYLYDLVENENCPTAVLEVPSGFSSDDGQGAGGETTKHSSGRRGSSSSTPSLLSDLAFNRKQRGFVAAADLSGAVHIWRLGWGLTAAAPSETEKLEAIESVAAGRKAEQESRSDR